MAAQFWRPYKRAMKLMTPVASVDHISVHSFFKSFEFRDAVLGKINDLNPRNASHRQLEGRVRTLLAMIEESRLGRYVDMSLGLFAWALVELERFVCIDDDQPDTRVGGYLDDLSRIEELFSSHRSEIEDFLKWKQSCSAA